MILSFQILKRINRFICMTFFITSFFILCPDIALADNIKDTIANAEFILIITFASFTLASVMAQALSKRIGRFLASIITAFIMGVPMLISMWMIYLYLYKNDMLVIALGILAFALFNVAGYHVNHFNIYQIQKDTDTQSMNNNL